MKNIIIFGMGADCNRILGKHPELLKSVIAFTSNEAKGGVMLDRPVIRPEEINHYNYDCVAIATSRFLLPVFRQCCQELSVPFEKILSLAEVVGEGLIEGTVIPQRIRLDACTLCQLDCTDCWMRRCEHPAVGDGYLKFKNFKKLLDENPSVKEVELSNNGEVFLNPELKEILEYAFEKQVVIRMGNGVNFNTVSEEMLETLVRTQVRFLNFSIDGTTQEVYAMYRRKGNLDRVIANIKRLNVYKEKYHSEFPTLQWQFILMKQNEHQVLEAKKMAEELNMRIFYKPTYVPGYVPEDPEYLKEVTGLEYLTEKAFLEKRGRLYGWSCRELFDFPAINYDGNLIGCCRVLPHCKKSYGVNVFESGLEGALSSAEYVNTKKLLLGDESAAVSEDNPCLECSAYQYMKQNDMWVKKEEIDDGSTIQ